MPSWEDRSTEIVIWREGGFEPKPSDSFADRLRGRLLWTSMDDLGQRGSILNSRWISMDDYGESNLYSGP